MKVLILAAGFGVRLREMIHGRPKPMAPVGDRPFLEHLILHLKKNNFKDIVLAVGYLSDYIVNYFKDGKKWGVNISYSVDSRPLGTAGTIKHAEQFFKSDFFVLNGDTFIDIDFNKIKEFHGQKKADVTIAVTRQFHGRGGLIKVKKDNRIESFDEISNKKPGGKGFNNAGLYIFNPRVLQHLNKGERTSLEKDLFPLLIKKQYRLFSYPIKKYLDIGSSEYYQKAIKNLKNMEEK
jgi:NDP-sugar pyrophosphorylase family protein